MNWQYRNEVKWTLNMPLLLCDACDDKSHNRMWSRYHSCNRTTPPPLEGPTKGQTPRLPSNPSLNNIRQLSSSHFLFCFSKTYYMTQSLWIPFQTEKVILSWQIFSRLASLCFRFDPMNNLSSIEINNAACFRFHWETLAVRMWGNQCLLSMCYKGGWDFVSET